MLNIKGQRIRCKYDRYSYCDIDEDDTSCDGCEYGRRWLAAIEDDYDDDPNDAYHRWRDDRDMKEKYGYV